MTDTIDIHHPGLSPAGIGAADAAQSSAERAHEPALDAIHQTSTYDFQIPRDPVLQMPQIPPHQPNGTSTPPGRRSVQFVRGIDSKDARTTPATAHPGLETLAGEPQSQRERLKQRMRSFGLSTRPHGHMRSRSVVSMRGEASIGASPITDGEDHNDVTDGEMGDNSIPPSPAPFSFGKRKRKPAPDWFAHTEPATPMDGVFERKQNNSQSQSPVRRLRPRPLRRATMTDVPEGARDGVSEDEGRARLANSPKWKRRSSAWLQGAQGQSFLKQRRSSKAEDTPEKSRLNHLRRLRRAGTVTDTEDTTPSSWRKRTDPKEGWRKLTQGRLAAALRMGQRRKVERGVDYVKSAELMAELLAGSPAAIIFASHFQPDELHKKKVPVLLEQLKVRIPDVGKTSEHTDRHARFRIELEYGNGLMRMQWVIWRHLSDFVNLHLKYKSESQIAELRNRTGSTGQKKLPGFPMKSFPITKNMFGSYAEPDDEEEEPDADEGSGGEDRSQTPHRPASHSQIRQFSNHGRSESGIHKKVSSAPTRTNTGGEGEPRQKEVFSERQRRKLELYLREMVRYLMFRGGSNRLCRFLEISALGVNLAAEGGYHGKEGKLTIKKHNTPGTFGPSKWFLVRESYIVCVESPEETVLADVFLVDSDFKFQARRPRVRDQKTAKDMAKTAKAITTRPTNHRLRLENRERKLVLTARNERHQEQFADSINAMWKDTIWAQKHRFDSFAPLRRNAYAEWLVDGRDYMWKVSRAIEMAENVVYIHDWWLSPELYMRRPPAISHKWRLDRLLQRKARQGVKIFIIMYRNINSAIPIDSEYSKQALLDLHPNIYVQRSPNQVRQQVFFWAHHEKICVVDHIVAFCGGVDLCFGRWDTPDHRVVDDKRTGKEHADFPRDADNCQMWPGKDYSNPRVQDFFDLFEPYGEMYDRNKTPRMPWHDIGMQIVGQPARDLSRHFVQRWNYLLRQRRAPGRGGPSRPIPILLPPPDFNSADLESLGFAGTCDVQMLRSCGEWSIGTPGKTERSIQNAYIKLIETSDHFVYIENQFFITSCMVESAQIFNQIGDALVERIIRAHKNGEDWAAVIVIPLMPGFQNRVDEQDGTSVRLIMECQFRSICRGETSIFGRLRAEGIDPLDYVQFYSLRQWGKIGPEKALTTEQLYIHAKCMIVDDRTVIIGSANINERSMSGDRDSEVAACVRDNDMIDSNMAGRPYKVSRFAHSLRVRLMREHLGIDVDDLRNHEVEEWSSTKTHVAHVDHINQGEWARSNSPQHDYFEQRDRALSSPVDFGREDSVRSRSESQLEHFGSMSSVQLNSTRELGRDTVLLEGGREVLVHTGVTEGKGTVSDPRKPTSLLERNRMPFGEPTFSSDNVVLPPPMPPRMETSELGLTQLSQLPPLPVTDDSDIGGPPIKITTRVSTGSLNGFISEIHRPVVEDDCMKDPLTDAYLQETWHKVAENNTKLYRHVFRCMPDSEVVTWEQYKTFDQYTTRFMESQGIGQSQTQQPQRTPSTTGPPGTGAVQRTNEKPVDPDLTTLDGSINDKQATGRDRSGTTSTSPPSVLRLHTANSVQSQTASENMNEAFNEKTSTLGDDSKKAVDFSSLPSKEDLNNESVSDDKRIPNSAPNVDGATNARRRRRATTKSSAMLRNTDPVLSRDDAEELLKLVQGHLVVFPYDWYVLRCNGSIIITNSRPRLSQEAWLYAIDTMAPLEI